GMGDDRKRTGLAFWVTALLVVGLVAYPLSFGPACWITSRTRVGASAIPTAYRPMTWFMSISEPAYDALDWYTGLIAAGGWGWIDQENEATGQYEPVWADVERGGMM